MRGGKVDVRRDNESRGGDENRCRNRMKGGEKRGKISTETRKTEIR
jgi:hypothetical protein